MNRQERKKRTDILFKSSGGITDAFDNMIKGVWHINDEEYDYICENATDEELDFFIGGNQSFSDKKKSLSIVDNLLNNMYNNS